MARGDPAVGIIATTGLVPPVVQIATAAESQQPGSMQTLLDACRERGDAVTFAQALTAQALAATPKA